MNLQKILKPLVESQIIDELHEQDDVHRILHGEAREITCLFFDIRGYTTLSEQKTPKDVFELINHYYKDIVQVVFGFQGMIDKFIGDAMMVVFNAPHHQPNHAHLAITCAKQIQSTVQSINAKQPANERIQIGIGIHTGDVYAGCVGGERRMDYTMIGDTVNVAARLVSKAEPGEILVSGDTKVASGVPETYVSKGPQQLAGRAHEIEVFGLQTGN